MDILVVEDSGGLRDLWVTVLGAAGHEVRGASGPAEARRILLTSPMDAILLDLNLGTESGLSVATVATWQNPECKVIVVTGSQLFPRGELFAMDASIVSVLRKPVAPGDLVAMVEHHARAAPISVH